MKNTILLGALLAAGACAQEKSTIPLSSPSQPATVIVRLLNGNIVVTPGQTGQITVEGVPDSNRRGVPEPPAGMHRVETGGALTTTEDHNTVTITPRGTRNGSDLTLQVPPNSSLRLKSLNAGHISVTGVTGDLEVETMNAAIEMKSVAGSVVAHSVNGAITVGLDKAAAGKPMSFTSMNGKLDVTLPGDTKARLRMKTQNGSVFTDFALKMEEEAPRSADGTMHRIPKDQAVSGSINGGGPDFRFETMNGDILIHRK